MRVDNLPTYQSMKAGHRVRTFRRGNLPGGRKFLGNKMKPWKNHPASSPLRSAA